VCACDGAVEAAPRAHRLQPSLSQRNDFLAELLTLAAHVNREVHPLGDDVHLEVHGTSRGVAASV
jgi:hypothetical protein